MNANVALQQYRQVGAQQALNANPHRLIQMLMEGALEKVSMARRFVDEGQIGAKGEHISWAISIIEGLRASLDLEQGGEIAENLERLYEYMNYRLLEANVNNDGAALDEVAGLLREVKAGWDGIAEQVAEAG